MNANKVCTGVLSYLKQLQSSGASFETIFRVTNGHAMTIVNAMLLHEEESVRTLFTNARAILNDMLQMPEKNDSLLGLSVFQGIYADLLPLAEAINRDDVKNGALAMRFMNVIKDLFNAWSAYANHREGSIERPLTMIVGVAMQVCAWHVAHAAIQSEQEIPFSDHASFIMLDEDFQWLEIFDSYMHEYMKCLAMLKAVAVPATT